MNSDLPSHTIKPAYPLGDVNDDAPAAEQDTTKKEEPKSPAKKVDEPQTDGE